MLSCEVIKSRGVIWRGVVNGVPMWLASRAASKAPVVKFLTRELAIQYIEGESGK